MGHFFTQKKVVLGQRSLSLGHGVSRSMGILTCGLALVACAGAVDTASESPARPIETTSIEIISEPPMAGYSECDECPEIVAVSLSSDKSLYVATRELTWAEYNFSVEQSQCPLPHQVTAIPSSDLPVTHISPLEFNCYLNWLNAKTRGGYRLPTAEEWRAFSKPVSQRRFPWGDELAWNNAVVRKHFDPALLKGVNGDHSWSGGRTPSIYSFLLPVGSFAPNERGIYDIVGSVAEYTSTWEPGPESCLRVASREECQVAIILGGGVFDPIGEGGFMSFSSKGFVNLQERIGFRIVRDGE